MYNIQCTYKTIPANLSIRLSLKIKNHIPTWYGKPYGTFFILYQMLTLKGKAVRVTISLFAKAVLGSSLLYMYYV